ncbi:hypothetical protein AVEN_203925-1 [Araneus ventricosus]|uniref:Uncharacterized protein n=1 Tax=Araneus ventricosus TaxID=182803 RepID=A0A4Y2JTZ7_ARAVE|nr:hypothetical protein AVEN_203925-1 [Araneus ventricosus]
MKNPPETSLVPVSRAAKIYLLLKTQITFSSRLTSVHEAKWHSISQNFKSFRPEFIFRNHHSYKGKFCSLVSQKFTLSILLRIRHCPVTYTLATLSLNTFVRQHLQPRLVSGHVRHCPFMDMFFPSNLITPEMVAVARQCCHNSVLRIQCLWYIV